MRLASLAQNTTKKKLAFKSGFFHSNQAVLNDVEQREIQWKMLERGMTWDAPRHDKFRQGVSMRGEMSPEPEHATISCGRGAVL